MFCYFKTMKKIYTLFAVIILSLNVFSQKDNSRYHNSWRLGLNLGGAWQTADYRSCWGMAGGFTLERGFGENATNIFSFAIRGRYLAANTYGMDYNRNYNIKDNYAYNGTYNPSVNYVDSMALNRRYVYDNYKMTLGEGSLELQLGFNRLRERTGVILNLWGGVGITSYRTKSDLLDGNGKRYDFSKIDSTGHQSNAINNYNTLIDKNYESFALGSKNGNLITFSPSAGIGLGYQLSPVFSVLWEYKVTFPQGSNADLLDGKYGNNKDVIAGSNDYYHYTGLNLLFTLRGKKKNKTVKEETVYTNTTTPTNTTVITPPTNSITPINTNTVAVNQPPKGPKPVITFITPSSNGSTVNNASYKISAQILNVENANQIQFKLNGTTYSNFIFNTQTKVLEYNSTLLKGSNSIHIIATNNVGVDDKLIYLFYEQPKPAGNPPVVTLINPASCPLASSSQSYNVVANVTNVASKDNLVVTVNKVVTSNYDFNSGTGKIELPISLLNGNNDFSIKAINSFGTDMKSCTVSLTKKTQTVKLPLVTITEPQQSGYLSSVNSYIVKAQVLNVSGAENIQVTSGTQNIPFTFDVATSQLNIPATLKAGSNVFSIQASNTAGTDTKTTSVVYVEKKATGRPPIVNLIAPAQITSTTSTSNNSFKFSVSNVASNGDVSVSINGTGITNFIYDLSSKELSFTSNLIIGNNTIVVKGTNQYGTDSKTINVNVIEKRPDIKKPPFVKIVNPINNMQTSSVATYDFKAVVTNITSTLGLVVKFNANPVLNYTYDGSNLNYTGTLNQGNNTFEVTATNSDGTDTKNTSVNYFKKIKTSPPVVDLINPATITTVSENPLYAFKFSVLNVSLKSNMQVLFNGNSVDFIFDSIAKEIRFTSTLNQGDNTVSVNASNSVGTDGKHVSVNYTPKVKLKTPPMVTITNPIQNQAQVKSNNYSFKATVTNIASVSGLNVKFNGTEVSNYTYIDGNLVYNTVLESGDNTFEVAATNSHGTDTKSVTVNYKVPLVPKPPVVVITAPVNTPTVNTVTYNFSFKAYNVTKEQLEVKVNEFVITQFNFVNNVATFSHNLTRDISTLSVKATNSDGSVTKTANVVKARVNQDSIPTSTATDGKMMTICHKSSDPNQPSQTMVVSITEWFSHAAHGDTQGECPTTPTNIIVNPGRPRVKAVEEKKDTIIQDKEENKQLIRPR